MTKIKMVWAEDKQHVIGKNGDLPWHLPDDLKLFKRETMGTLMIMGRTTWDSIGRPLPNRTTLVLTHQTDWQPGYDDVLVAHSMSEVLAKITAEDRDVTIAGGATMYQAFMPYATDLIITKVAGDVAGDTFAPTVDLSQFELIASQPHPKDEKHDYAFVVERYQRKN